MMVK
jgi:hypothetical protein